MIEIGGAIRKMCAESPQKFDPRDYFKPAYGRMKEVCVARMTPFGQAGNAGHISPVCCADFVSHYVAV